MILWVFVYNLLNRETGLVNTLLVQWGLPRFDAFNSPRFWIFGLNLAYLWKWLGYGTVIQAYTVTIVNTVAGTSVGLFIIAMAGYVLQRPDCRYHHLQDNRLVLILPMLMNPFLIILMKNFIKTSVPHEIVEAAIIDGAGDSAIFVRIILQLATPGLATIGLFLALAYWNDWFMSSLYISTTSKDCLDLSKRVELQFWMLGNAPQDLQMVEDEVNKMALEDLICTVKYDYTTWTDWSQKYKLMLISGQPIDLLLAAEWTEYQRYARSGAFLELEEIVPAAAPELNEFIPEDYWDAVKVDGHIYTMPNTYVYDGFEYREDLRKKYGLPDIDSVETIEMYLDAIVENEPGMIALGEGAPAPTDST